MENMSIVNMAFAQGAETSESIASFDKYVGVGTFTVIAVNPTLKEMQQLFPKRNIEKEPNYQYDKEGDTKGTIVTFFLKSQEEGVEFYPRATCFLKAEAFYNRDKTKVQVINDYGDTKWILVEDYKHKTFPHDFIPTGARPAFVGEEKLVKFLRTIINIPISRDYKNGSWVVKSAEDLKAALCGFSPEEIKQILSGNVKVIRDALKYNPDNKIKLPCSVRTVEDKEYQEVHTEFPIKLNSGLSGLDRFKKDLTNAMEAGMYSNNDFGAYPYIFKKYEVTPTTFGKDTTDDLPFGSEDPFAAFTR